MVRLGYDLVPSWTLNAKRPGAWLDIEHWHGHWYWNYGLTDLRLEDFVLSWTLIALMPGTKLDIEHQQGD